MRWGFTALSTAAVLVLAACSDPGGSASSAQSPSATGGAYARVAALSGDITVPVSPDRALSVAVPQVGRIIGAAGAFSAAGSITIRRESAAFTTSSGLRSAGLGVDVLFHGTSLRKPLTVTFAASATPAAGDADELPVIAHLADDGTWDVQAAQRDGAGQFSVTTSSFSLNLPGWADPVKWWDALTAKLASAIGGRTSPVTCSGAPSWFHLDAAHSDLVHVCATTNTSGGKQVAEVQIKSNRGVSLEVSVPGNPAYVWVQGESWTWRQTVAHALGFDPNQTVILPAGATMTVGYPQDYTSLPFSFYVSGATGKAAADTAIRDLVDFVAGDKAPGSIAVGYTEVKCATGLGIGATGVSLSVAALHEFLSCWTGSVSAQLRDRDNALKVASQFGGSSADVDSLVSIAKSLNALGWLVSLWPVFQLGIGNDVDKIRDLLSSGESSLVSYHMDPITAPGSAGGASTGGAGAGGSGGGNPTVHLAQGPAAPTGYRYAVSISGFAPRSSVSVSCYDSASPAGFYTFSLQTDASGAASTQSQCYSGDGPDHWVVAGGLASNHVQWSSAPAPPPPTSAPPPPSTRPETVGGPTNTWSNYSNAGGTHGPTIPAYTTVQIACKVTGFKVADGNTWWYRIASPGWDGNFYASADAFYNNGATSGSLHGTPFVDPAVPDC